MPAVGHASKCNGYYRFDPPCPIDVIYMKNGTAARTTADFSPLAPGPAMAICPVSRIR